jgi:type II secretory pathway pseudopilin PulG
VRVRGRATGFSLAELLVYIVLLALLSTAVAEVFTMSVRYTHTAQASSDLEASAQLTVQRLFDEVAQSSWHNVYVFDSPPAVVFISAETPSGVVSLNPAGALIGQSWVCYYWDFTANQVWRKQQWLSSPTTTPDLGDLSSQSFVAGSGKVMASNVTEFEPTRVDSPPMLTLSASFATSVAGQNDTSTQIVDGVMCRNP